MAEDYERYRPGHPDDLVQVFATLAERLPDQVPVRADLVLHTARRS